MRRLHAKIERLHPGYLAMVMATGIISTAAHMFDMNGLSALFLALAIGAYVFLMPLYIWRFLRFRATFLADMRAPGRAFSFFTLTASSNVLGVRLAFAGWLYTALVLAIMGAAIWLALTYLIPYLVMTQDHKTPLGTAVNGTWLVWVVGTQSVSAVISTVALELPALTAPGAVLGIMLWAFGCVLYLVLMSVLIMRLFFAPMEPIELSPPYWITMGATAITVLAGSRILLLPHSLVVVNLMRPMVEGASFTLWTVGTWWIPLLLLWGIWRHIIHRVRFDYEPAFWSMVFPLGMYPAASAAFGRVTGLPFMVSIARWAIWFAVLAWLLVCGSMLLAWYQRRA